MPVFFLAASHFSLAGPRSDPSLGSMRPLRSVFLFSTLVFLGGRAFGPLGVFFDPMGLSPSAWVRGMEECPVPSVCPPVLHPGRLSWSPLVLRGLGITNARDLRRAVQLPCWKPLAAGAATSFLSLALVLACQLAHVGCEGVEGRTWRGRNRAPSDGSGTDRIRGGGARRNPVPVGSLRRACARFMRKAFSMILSSAIYAIVHFFLSRPESPLPITWLSGLRRLPSTHVAWICRTSAWSRWFRASSTCC